MIKNKKNQKPSTDIKDGNEAEGSKEKLSFLADDEQDENQLQKFSMSDVAAFKKLASYAGPHKLGLIGGLLLLMGSSLCALASARNLGALVEDGLLKSSEEASFRLAWLHINF